MEAATALHEKTLTLILSLVVIARLIRDPVLVRILPDATVISSVAGAGVSTVDYVLHWEISWWPRPFTLNVDAIWRERLNNRFLYQWKRVKPGSESSLLRCRYLPRRWCCHEPNRSHSTGGCAGCGLCWHSWHPWYSSSPKNLADQKHLNTHGAVGRTCKQTIVKSPQANLQTGLCFLEFWLVKN